MITLPIRGTAIAAALLLSPDLAQAAAVTFFGEDLNSSTEQRLTATPSSDEARAAFIAEIGGGRLETFESFEGGTFAWTQQPDSSWTLGRQLDFADSVGTGDRNLTGSLSARTGTVVDQPQGTVDGRYATDGNKFFHSTASEVVFDLDQSIYAFGFNGIDVGDFDGQLVVDIYNENDLLQSVTIDHTTNGIGGDVFFWGFADIDNPFNQVVLNNSNPGIDVFGIDGAMTAIPIPGALPLLATGLVALVWMRRRRRAAA